MIMILELENSVHTYNELFPWFHGVNSTLSLQNSNRAILEKKKFFCLFSGLQSKSTYKKNFTSNPNGTWRNSKLQYCSDWHSKGDPFSPCHFFFLLAKTGP